MRYFSKILIIATTIVILTLSLALAGAKFQNKDTAKDRRDNVFGTEMNDDTATTTIDKNDTGDTVIKSKSRPKPEEVDWYDKVIITVNPDTRWPKNQTSTTTTTGYNNATDVETSTTTIQKVE